MSAAIQDAASPEQILQEVSQFSDAALDKFFNQVLLLRAERRAPHLSLQEEELLLKINQPLPEPTWKRYTKLYARLQANAISKAEYAELLQLIDVVETDNAERIGHLIELANLRGTTLEALMKSLGIGPRPHG